MQHFSQKITDALSAEQRVRAEAILGIDSIVCGVRVRPLTPRHILALSTAHNAFFSGRSPLLADVFDFLWFTSRAYCAPVHPEFLNLSSNRILRLLCLWISFGSFSKARLYRSLEKHVYGLDLFPAADAINQHLDRVMQDRPATLKKNSDSDKYSPFEPRSHLVEHLIQCFWSDYNSPPDTTLDTPIALLWSTLRIQTITSGGLVIDRSSEVIRKELSKTN